MADMPGDFWSGWIVTLTLVSLGVMVWLVFSIYFSPGAHREEEDANPPVWDEDLEEGTAPAPMWWFWLIFGSMIFSVIYLILYPGLGSFSGVLTWSQDARVHDAYSNYESRFTETREDIARSKLADLQTAPALMQSAGRIFDRECSACHGADGRGQALMFPDLRDGAWQWGASPEQIEQSIRKGRQATMPGWQANMDSEALDQVTDYSIALGSNVAEEHPGRQAYATYCVACHGPKGGGNPALGAPALDDDAWLYGGDREAVRHSIAEGRNGVMPAFGDRLDDTQIRLLVAWLTR